MKNFKTYAFAVIGMFFLGSAVFAGRISYQILDSDPRFQPIDAFHKGCEQSALVSLAIKEKAITKIHITLSYDPNQVEIVRVNAPDTGAGKYKIEYDRLVVDQSSPVIKNGSTDLFRMTFKGTPQST